MLQIATPHVMYLLLEIFDLAWFVHLSFPWRGQFRSLHLTVDIFNIMFEVSQYGYVNLPNTVIVVAVIKASVVIIVSIVTLIVWSLKLALTSFLARLWLDL